MRTIAVVAVHGVADQKPSESARQIANLLTDLSPRGRYSTFVEEGIRIPVEPVRVSTDGPPAAPRGRRAVFEERNPDAIARHRRGKAEGRAAVDAGAVATPPPDVAFMEDQLREYEPDADMVFETVRVAGTHAATGAGVHVFEAYWADLSRPAAGLLAFFLELYQLLLHLPSVGRNAVDYARAAHAETAGWGAFSWLHRWSIRWLTVFIAAMNLVMATLIPAILAPRLMRTASPGDRFAFGAVLAYAILGLAVLTAVAEVLRRSRPIAWPLWVAAPLVAFALGCTLAWPLCGALGTGRVLVFEVWLLTAAVAVLVLRKYDEMRPGALLTGVAALLATAATLAACLYAAVPSEDDQVAAVMTTIELVDVALALVWRIHVPWLVFTIAWGVACAAASPRARRQAAWQTVWTAQATLCLSTVVFANLTLAGWQALFTGAGRLVGDADFAPVAVDGLSGRLLGLPPESMKLRDYIATVIEVSATSAFVWSTIVLGIVLAVTTWSIFPCVLAEAAPPRGQPRDREPLRRLGRWLSRGLQLIPAALWTLPVLYALVIAAGIHDLSTGHGADPWSRKAIAAAGASVLGLIAARFWLPGASGVLDVVLDVDNYLRQHPRHATPRARMAARHASLLRFLVTPEACGRHYDAIVIVAHSQGSVITADLLRFLRAAEPRIEGLAADPWIARLRTRPVILFTMGCPMRQLYARAFPWLYEWARPAGEAGRIRPHPHDLGIETWRNAYRSGDYVGRMLWRDDTDDRAWDRRADDPQSAGAPRVVAFDGEHCAEMCIGAGAHTHYWDHHGADIARELDRLIMGCAVR